MWMSLSLFHGGCHFPANRQEVREIRTGRNSFCIEINGICTGLGMPIKLCFNLTCIFIFYLIFQKINLSCLWEEPASVFSPCSFRSTDFQLSVCSQTAADVIHWHMSPHPVGQWLSCPILAIKLTPSSSYSQNSTATLGKNSKFTSATIQGKRSKVPLAWAPRQLLGSDFLAALALWISSLIWVYLNSNEKNWSQNFGIRG